MDTRLKKLERKHTWTESHTKHLLRIDKEITQAMLHAEKRVTPTHTAPWNPKIHTAYMKVRKLTTKANKRSQDPHQYERTHLLDKKYKQALQELRSMRKRKQAVQNRENFLEDKADIMELKGQSNRAAIIRNII